MNHQLELGYLVLEVRSPDRLDSVFAEVVGLVPGEPTASGARTWRNDQRAHRIVVQPGPANDAVAIGLEAVDAEAFDETLATPPRRWAWWWSRTPREAEGRQVGRLARTTAPWGSDVEIVLALGDAPTPFSSALVPGGFLTDGVGFGHVVFATTAFDESAAFLTDGLGLRVSRIGSRWRSPRASSSRCASTTATRATTPSPLARAPFELPQVLHHVMFETNDRDDVGARVRPPVGL